jgi:hypothetical protein
MEPAAGNGGLANDNSVQQWLRGVGVWPGEQEPAVMAKQPGVQGLHAAEVRNLDELRMPRLRVHKAAPQDQDATVLAGPETIALLHYPGRRCQTEGGLAGREDGLPAVASPTIRIVDCRCSAARLGQCPQGRQHRRSALGEALPVAVLAQGEITWLACG